jgi:hypothetical protein
MSGRRGGAGAANGGDDAGSSDDSGGDEHSDKDSTQDPTNPNFELEASLDADFGADASPQERVREELRIRNEWLAVQLRRTYWGSVFAWALPFDTVRRRSKCTHCRRSIELLTAVLSLSALGS